MTTALTVSPSLTALADQIQNTTTPNVDYMFGIGLEKDSDAVYFQYVGDKDIKPFLKSNGNPVTQFSNITITGLSIKDNAYQGSGFPGHKLNVFIELPNGQTIMLTSGLTSLWSRCMITGLMELFITDSLNSSVSISTWKGTSKMKPCFASIAKGNQKMANKELKENMNSATGNNREEIIRKSVALISEAITGLPVVTTSDIDSTY